MRRFFSFVFMLEAFYAVAVLPSAADNPYLTSGIAAFNKGQYAEAIGFLGAAKPTEYDNPLFHYYMANCLVKVNQKTDAIKEYKLALDLAPEGQLKQYCHMALQALEPAPVSSASKAPIPNQEPAAPVRLTGVQQPQVVSVLCGCPLCARLDIILTSLQSKYGDKVNFVRSQMQTPGTRNTIVEHDERLKEIFQHYSITQCPTVMVFDNQGGMGRVFSNYIPEPDLTKAIDDVAKTSPPKSGIPSDQHLASQRETIVNDFNSRVSHDQLRLDQEIKQIETETTQQIEDIRNQPRNRGSGYFNQSQIQTLQDDAKTKIKALREDSERRKADWAKAEEEQLQALQSTQSFRRSQSSGH